MKKAVYSLPAPQASPASSETATSPCFRLLPDGSPDPLFGTDGLTTTTFGEAFDDANALVITPENKAVLVGMSAQTNNDFAIARYFLGPVIDGVEESVAQLSVYPNPTRQLLHMAHSEHLTAWSLRTPLGQDQ